MRFSFRLRRALAPALLALLAAGPAHAVIPAPNFEVTNLSGATVFDTPTTIAFLADGRLLVGEKRGAVWMVTNGVRSAQPLWVRENEVLNSDDRGLLGVAADPNYNTNHFIYLLYTVDPDSNGSDDNPEGFGRLTRYQVGFTDSSVVVPSSRTILMGTTWADGPLEASPSHTIGALRWGHDGSLLVSTGDGANFNYVDAGGITPNAFLPGRSNPIEDIGAYRSQYIHSLCGKVLRLDPTNGHGYPSNPYWSGDGTATQSKVWAYGVRNPFRFVVRPGTGVTDPAAGDPGTLYLGDVGWITYEELNIVDRPGQNLGWPCREGFQPTGLYTGAPQQPARADCGSLGTSDNPATSFTQPVVVAHHSQSTLSTPQGFVGNTSIGAAFYTGTLYPANLQGKYFACDFGQNWIKVADIDTATHQVVSLTDFATQCDGPVDFAIDPLNGDLVYCSIYTGQIRRFHYLGVGTGNVPPIAVATGTPDVGVAPLTVQFSSAGSHDDNGDTLSYVWNFGDQATSNVANPLHVYTDPGTYLATLTVDDGHGATAVANVTVLVATSTSFPTTGIVDDFNRESGAIGPNWTGDTGSLQVVNEQLTEISLTASAVFSSQTFGPTQEAYFTFNTVTPNAPEHNLMIKVQGNTWDTGHIEVRFDEQVNTVVVSTYAPGQGWVQRSDPVSTTFQAGDQFGVRAYGNGVVQVFKNGVPIATADVTGWPFLALGGHLGLTLTGATATYLDDFGGGNANLNPNTAPQVTIATPLHDGFYATGDTISLTCVATDQQQADTALAYRWDVDLHHNNHVHPESHVFNTKSASFIAENHDDGTGVWMEIRVKTTDAGSLADMDTVFIYPEIDLSPSDVTVKPDPPSSDLPMSFRFSLRNFGRMPAPYSRWRLIADGTMLAEGDTLVQPHDSVTINVTVPPSLAPGTYTLRLVADTLQAVRDIDKTNNASTRTLTVAGPALAVTPGVSAHLALSSAYPNPSGGRVEFALELPRESRVAFDVLDLAGRSIWSEAGHAMGAGRWTLGWSGRTAGGSRAGAGMYLARVRVDGRELVRRFVLLQ